MWINVNRQGKEAGEPPAIRFPCRLLPAGSGAAKLAAVHDAVPQAAGLLLVAVWMLLVSGTSFADTHYVDINGSKSVTPYTSWETAAKSIHDAVDAAGKGDTVIVGDGTYNIRSTIGISKGLTVRSANGRETTTVNANRNCRVFKMKSDNGPITLEGLTITGGYVDSGWAHGGGIAASGNGDINILGCIIEHNEALNGGGIRVGASKGQSTSTTISNCIIRNNKATSVGGGIETEMWQDSSGSITIENCLIAGNSAKNSGGGIGGISIEEKKEKKVVNCTVVGNYGGGVKGVYLYNSIVYHNRPYDIDMMKGTVIALNSCARNAPHGEGNIDELPRFVNAKSGDFRLLPSSPCIDAGSNPHSTQSTDLNGNPRIMDGNRDGDAVVDMGAYEFQILHVEIDIKPGSKSSSINLKVGGLLPVAILTTKTFDASTVDPPSVRFAGSAPQRYALEDIDADGDVDLLLQFQRRSLKLTAGSTRLLLTGQTSDKQLFSGEGAIKIISTGK